MRIRFLFSVRPHDAHQRRAPWNSAFRVWRERMQIRFRICEGLEFLGIKIDEKQNASNTGVISGADGRVTVRVIHTDEELTIARSVCKVIGLDLHLNSTSLITQET